MQPPGKNAAHLVPIDSLMPYAVYRHLAKLDSQPQPTPPGKVRSGRYCLPIRKAKDDKIPYRLYRSTPWETQMINIEKVDTFSKNNVQRFVRFPYHLYRNHSYWVPPLFIDAEMYLNRTKHPFFEHSDADFFIATRDGNDVGRVAILENKPFNSYHGTRQAQFYFFDCEEDQEATNALFERVFSWANERGLDRVVGPKGFGPLDGYGLLIEGFEYRQMMTMMNYNYPYYPRLLINLGFEKEVDFVSCYLSAEAFHLPERIQDRK